MCLAIPAEIIEVDFPFAIVDLGGARKKIRIDLIDDVKPGDYVLVHVGFAIQKVNKEELEEIEKLWEQMFQD